MASVSQQIIQNSNLSTLNKTQQEKTYSTSVSGDDFLVLMTEQLKYQDPTNPMDNNDMLAQEAQFQSLSRLEELSDSFSKFSNMFQANSLIGQNVEIMANNKTITGTVDYVDYTDTKGASVSINNTLYPISSISKVFPSNSSSTGNSNSSSGGSEETIGQKLLESINDNIGKIASKLGDYLKIDELTSSN